MPLKWISFNQILEISINVCHHVYSPRPRSHAQKHSSGYSFSERISRRVPSFSSPLLRASWTAHSGTWSLSPSDSSDLAFTHPLAPSRALNQKLFRCSHSFGKPFSLLPLQPQPTRAAHHFPSFLSPHSATSTQAASPRQVGKGKGPSWRFLYQTSASPQPTRAWLSAVAGSDAADGWDRPAATNARPVPTAVCRGHAAPFGSIFMLCIEGEQGESCKSVAFPWGILAKQQA